MHTQLTQSLKPRQVRVVHNLTWEQLDEFDRSLEDVTGVKLAHLNGTLEIMTIGEEHEDAKATMRVLLEVH